MGKRRKHNRGAFGIAFGEALWCFAKTSVESWVLETWKCTKDGQYILHVQKLRLHTLLGHPIKTWLDAYMIPITTETTITMMMLI
jgi:hypothetical protein